MHRYFSQVFKALTRGVFFLSLSSAHVHADEGFCGRRVSHGVHFDLDGLSSCLFDMRCYTGRQMVGHVRQSLCLCVRRRLGRGESLHDKQDVRLAGQGGFRSTFDDGAVFGFRRSF